MAKKKNTMDPKVQKLFETPEEYAFYEMLLVFKPHLPDPVRQGLEKKIEAILKKFDAGVKAKAVWGKRIMAYKIAGNKEGYYVMYYFESPVKSVEKIKKELNRITELLRHMILRLEDMSLDSLKLLAKKAEVME